MSDETKNEFTPGPWTVDRLRIIRNGTQPTGLFNVADCADPTANQRDGNIEERIANAKMIAANTDMFAALVLCVEDYEDNGGLLKEGTPIHIMAARAAIDKARNG